MNSSAHIQIDELVLPGRTREEGEHLVKLVRNELERLWLQDSRDGLAWARRLSKLEIELEEGLSPKRQAWSIAQKLRRMALERGGRP